MSYIYLASPYSHTDEDVLHQRFEAVCEAAAYIMNRKEDNLVFSPIAHCHPIAMAHNLPKGYDYWQKYDEIMISNCSQVYLLQIDGWQHSKGMRAEAKFASEINKPLVGMIPTKDTLNPYKIFSPTGDLWNQ
jgi:hypothetical protein